MVVHPGSIKGYGKDPDIQQKTVETNVSFFSDIGTLAKKYNVYIAIENLFDQEEQYKGIRFGSKMEDLLLLLNKLDNPWFGICWDTGHANLQGLKQGACIKQAGLKLIALHLNDNNGIIDQHRVPFSDSGTCDWQDILNALKEINFSEPYNFEIPGSTDCIPLELRDEFVRYCYKAGHYIIRESVTTDSRSLKIG